MIKREQRLLADSAERSNFTESKVNLIINHVKIKTVSHTWLRSFCWAWGLGVKRARTGGLTSQITEQINAKLLKTVETNPFYRMNLRQITEKTQAKLPKN